MGKIRGLIFDLDHTLYDYPPCNQAGQLALIAFLAKRLSLSRQRVQKLLEEARTYIHDTIPTQAASHSRLLYSQLAIEQALGRTDPSLTLAAEQIFWRAYFTKMTLRPGLEKLLQNTRPADLIVGVASDLTSAIQLQKLKHLRISQYIDYLVTSEEVGHEKPQPQMVRRLLTKMQCRASEVLYIGDSLTRDLVVAQRLHMQFYLLNSNRLVSPLRRQLSSH